MPCYLNLFKTVVKYNCVSDNFNLTCLLLFIEDVIKVVRISTCDSLLATQQSHLKTHKQSKHEGVIYSCDECDHRAMTQSNLKQHQESKHEGVIYSCNQCNYKATYQPHLRTHKQSKHEGVKYYCIECDYQSGFQSGLKRHQQSKHAIGLLKSG